MNKLSKLEQVIDSYGSIKLSILPTSIHKMKSLSDQLGVRLYCKRDDLTGFAFGGNKTRKLDYLMNDAVHQGADCIVTFGSNQSNWCRMASAAASSLGMDVYLVLDGEEPSMPSGNLILDKLVGASIEYINSTDPDIAISKSLLMVDELKKAGRKPYFLPVGGSVPLGSLGYIEAFSEIIDYSSESGIEFDRIFVASGSAGTQAGLICGKLLAGWRGEIIGVSVGRDKAEQEEMVFKLAEETFEMLDIAIDSDSLRDSVIVDDNYYGEGYRQNTPEAGEAIRMFARHEGIFLDEVYTGKAASALITYSQKGKLPDNQNVLFIHTGGGIQLFE